MKNPFKIQIYADGADLEGMRRIHREGIVGGFTTNPSLMKKAGVTDYEAFSRQILKEIRDVPVSFEVIADDFKEMERQADTIASWGDNVFVKIPVTDPKGNPAAPLIGRLAKKGVKLNITAILTEAQVREVGDALRPDVPSIVSVFAGRIADTGVDPVPMLKRSRTYLAAKPAAMLLWASCRELLNIRHAEESGCHIITVTHDILAKLSLFGKDLAQYSLETVRMFDEDARKAGLKL